MKPLSEKSATVLKYLQENQDKDLTAADIAEAIGSTPKSVNPVITAGLSREDRKLAFREEATIEVEKEDGSTTTKTIKFIRLTDLGKTFKPGVDDVEDAE